MVVALYLIADGTWIDVWAATKLYPPHKKYPYVAHNELAKAKRSLLLMSVIPLLSVY